MFEPAKVSLLEAMIEAAGRDTIARQYANAFADIFDRGLPLLEGAHRQGVERKWATLAIFLEFLAALPDSHIVRKLDAQTAEQVRNKAVIFAASLRAAKQPERLLAELLAWDAELKAEGINPGTSADLTVAALFADRLADILAKSIKNG